MELFKSTFTHFCNFEIEWSKLDYKYLESICENNKEERESILDNIFKKVLLYNIIKSHNSELFAISNFLHDHFGLVKIYRKGIRKNLFVSNLKDQLGELKRLSSIGNYYAQFLYLTQSILLYEDNLLNSFRIYWSDIALLEKDYKEAFKLIESRSFEDFVFNEFKENKFIDFLTIYKKQDYAIDEKDYVKLARVTSKSLMTVHYISELLSRYNNTSIRFTSHNIKQRPYVNLIKRNLDIHNNKLFINAILFQISKFNSKISIKSLNSDINLAYAYYKINLIYCHLDRNIIVETKTKNLLKSNKLNTNSKEFLFLLLNEVLVKNLKYAEADRYLLGNYRLRSYVSGKNNFDLYQYLSGLHVQKKDRIYIILKQMLETNLLSVKECFQYYRIRFKYDNIKVEPNVFELINYYYNKIDRDRYLLIDSESDFYEEILRIFASENHPYPNLNNNVADKIIERPEFLFHPKFLVDFESTRFNKPFVLAIKVLEFKFDTISRIYNAILRQEKQYARDLEIKNHDYYSDTRNELGMDYDDWVDFH